MSKIMVTTMTGYAQMKRWLMPIGLLVSGVVSIPAHSSTGGLDPSFGDGGLVEFAVPGISWVAAQSVIQQEDGKIVAAGYGTDENKDRILVLVRTDANGNIDAAFGNGGFATGTSIGDNARVVAQQSDGKLILQGSNQGKLAFWRFGENGLADAGFGAGGAVHLDIEIYSTSSGIVEQLDGSLVAAVTTSESDSTDVALVRIRADGSLDSEFQNGGVGVLGQGVVLALREQSDGKLLVLSSWGDDLIVTRALPDGSPDESFGINGVVRVSADLPNGLTCCGDLAVQADGNIVAAAHVGTDFYFFTEADGLVFRLFPDGELDHSFGDGGLVLTETAHGDSFHGVAVTPDGRILVGGNHVNYPIDTDGQNIAWDMALTRFLPDGSTDLSFGPEGRVIADFSNDDMRRYSFAWGMERQVDGRVVLAGNAFGGNGGYMLALARFEQEASGAAGRIRPIDSKISLQEDAGFAEVRVIRTGGSAGLSTVRYETVDGSASAGNDFVASSGEISWQDGDAEDKIVRIEVLDDSVHEDDERFLMVLTSVEGAAVVSVSETTINIADNDPIPPSATVPPSSVPASPDSGGGSSGPVILLSLLLGIVLQFVRCQKPCTQRA